MKQGVAELEIVIIPRLPGRLKPYLGQIKAARLKGASWMAIRDGLVKAGINITQGSLIEYARKHGGSGDWATPIGLGKGRRPAAKTGRASLETKPDFLPRSEATSASASLVTNTRVPLDSDIVVSSPLPKSVDDQLVPGSGVVSKPKTVSTRTPKEVVEEALKKQEEERLEREERAIRFNFVLSKDELTVAQLTRPL